MPQHKSTIKRVRQNKKIYTRNAQARSTMRTAIKDVRKATAKEEASSALIKAISEVDRAANRGLIHRNTAARYKSRLTRFVNTMDA